MCSITALASRASAQSDQSDPILSLEPAATVTKELTPFEAARALLVRGRYAEAERAAQQLATDPKLRTAALTLCAEARSAVGQLDSAEAAFKEALADPSAEPLSALRAHVLYARLLIERGRKPEAAPHLQALIEAYNDDRLGATARQRAASISYVAMAARMLGSAHDANDAFREAALADRSRVETQLEWAELFLEKHDVRHARESVLEALEHKPKSPRALVLLARLVLAQSYDFAKVEGYVAKALAVNPSYVPAHVTRAAMALREMDIEAADRNLDAALAIHPNHLEALSVRAAVRFLADDAPGFAAAQAAVLTRNPRYSRMYTIIAEHAEWEHRYPELIEMAKKALAIDPDDASAQATLAINLLRAGDEKRGRAALEQAWDRDHFNAQVLNLITLYENVIDREYVDFEAAPFVLRMHKQERASLEPYAVPMFRKAYDIMQRRYGFTPEGPLRLEMYADTEHFSVRTTGMPNVGVQGVCFGKVITAVSPAAGPFNWGQITWHELAHIFHLQLSKNHVPRWFTEGLAEHETVVARVEWRREEDSALWTAFAQDRVPKLADLNRAFTQAKTPQALMTAYYLASQAVGYIVERFGWDKMRPMLLAWGAGKRTADVFREVLHTTIEDVDRDLRAHLHKRLERFDRDFHVDFSRYEDLAALERAAALAPNDAQAQAQLALGLIAQRKLAAGEKAARRALALDPKQTGALFALTRVALENEDLVQVERLLRAILATGQDGYVIRILLARAALASKRLDDAIKEADAATRIDPDQLEAHRVLLDVAAARAAAGAPDPALAQRAIKALALLDQHDPVLQLAWIAALREAKSYAELRVAAERALYLIPAQPDVHLALGQGLIATGDPAAALVEIDRAESLGHKRPDEVSRIRAQARAALQTLKLKPARRAP